MSTTNINPSPSLHLAKSLKEYAIKAYYPTSNNRNKKVTSLMVVGFNSTLFYNKCHPASAGYDPSIDFDILADELFKVGDKWSSRDGTLMEAMDDLEKVHGFHVRKEKELIVCNRLGKADTERSYVGGDLKAQCTFKLKLKALSKLAYKANPLSTRWSYTNIWTEPIEIVEACCRHGGQCRPSRLNRVMATQRAGKYVKKIPDMVLFSLCNYLERRGKITSSMIKDAIEPHWPEAKNVSKHDVFNIRAKLIKLLPSFQKTNGDYEEFKKVANSNDMLSGIDNTPSLDDDEAYQLAQSLWLEVSNTSVDRDEAIFSFIEYLELIKSRAKGFTYKLARDSSDKKKKLLGVVWQTATMRRNFELYGSYLSLDMMKRGINTLLWPYSAVAMYDDNMNICIACEGILCGERLDMYQFLALFLSENSPGRLLSAVNVVSGDGFFDQNMITELGFINARFITDQWHLFDSGLQKMFGKSAHDLLKSHLSRMIHAPSEKEFEDTFCAGQDLLKSVHARDGELEQKFEDFAALRDTYAQYCLDQIPGNRGLHGSSSSESNHSSVLASLNGGHKKGNSFCEHPIVLIRELLKRQKMHVNKTNARLFGESQKLTVERYRLDTLPTTPLNDRLRSAASVLNHVSYERYKRSNDAL